VTHPDHHAGDGCAAAITAAHEALADVLQRVEQQLTAVAELLQQRPGVPVRVAGVAHIWPRSIVLGAAGGDR
jgi:hypothetical protein